MTRCLDLDCSGELETMGEFIVCSECGCTISRENTDSQKKWILLTKLFYISPIIVLIFITVAFSILALANIFTIDINTNSDNILNNSISLGPIVLTGDKLNEIIAKKLLVYFFIFLALIDLNALVIKFHVHPLLTGDAIPPQSEKIYLETLLVFGIIIIILDIFSKLFTENSQNLPLMLISSSIVLISISVWKYYSLKSEKFLKNKSSNDKP